MWLVSFLVFLVIFFIYISYTTSHDYFFIYKYDSAKKCCCHFSIIPGKSAISHARESRIESTIEEPIIQQMSSQIPSVVEHVINSPEVIPASLDIKADGSDVSATASLTNSSNLLTNTNKPHDSVLGHDEIKWKIPHILLLSIIVIILCVVMGKRLSVKWNKYTRMRYIQKTMFFIMNRQEQGIKDLSSRLLYGINNIDIIDYLTRLFCLSIIGNKNVLLDFLLSIKAINNATLIQQISTYVLCLVTAMSHNNNKIRILYKYAMDGLLCYGDFYFWDKVITCCILLQNFAEAEQLSKDAHLKYHHNRLHLLELNKLDYFINILKFKENKQNLQNSYFVLQIQTIEQLMLLSPTIIVLYADIADYDMSLGQKSLDMLMQYWRNNANPVIFDKCLEILVSDKSEEGILQLVSLQEKNWISHYKIGCFWEAKRQYKNAINAFLQANNLECTTNTCFRLFEVAKNVNMDTPLNQTIQYALNKASSATVYSWICNKCYHDHQEMWNYYCSYCLSIDALVWKKE